MQAWSFDSRRPSRGEARLEVGARLGWRLGKAEEVVGNFYAQVIEARRPEEGDRREGAAGNELSSALSEGRRKREMSEQIRTKKG